MITNNGVDGIGPNQFMRCVCVFVCKRIFEELIKRWACECASERECKEAKSRAPVNTIWCETRTRKFNLQNKKLWHMRFTVQTQTPVTAGGKRESKQSTQRTHTQNARSGNMEKGKNNHATLALRTHKHRRATSTILIMANWFVLKSKFELS